MNIEGVLARVEYQDMGHATPCWIWQGSTCSGYGRCTLGIVHRLTYEALVGPIPSGLHIDHLCRNRACCNPAHLEPVTPAENARRGLSYDRRTHCWKGHLLADTLRVYSNGSRQCSVCKHKRRKELEAGAPLIKPSRKAPTPAAEQQAA